MSEVIKDTFEITVTGEKKKYKITARAPGLATQEIPMKWPPKEWEDTEITLLKLSTAFDVNLDYLKEVGGALYQALFPDEIEDRYKQFSGKTGSFRIRLMIHPPELAHLPWEFLYDKNRGSAGWLAVRNSEPLVRAVPNTDIAQPLAEKGPLKVLFIGANPKGTAKLAVEEDERRLREALKDLGDKVKLLKPEMHITADKLRDRLREDEPHVIHYSGHGDFDAENSIGYLLWEDDMGEIARMDGDTLAVTLSKRSVRLVVLSACRTAEINEQQPFVGVSQQLANSANLPGVIAMQFPIGDENAVTFNKEFYKAIADRFPVDKAVAEGRLAVFSRIDKGKEGRELVDWATPIVFMLGESGQLWEEEKMSEDDKKKGGINLNIGRDVKGGVNVSEGDMTVIKGDNVQGDKVMGDKVGGDKITVGNISGSNAVAIGRGASASVTQGADAAEIMKAFGEIVKSLEGLKDADKDDVADAKDEVAELQEHLQGGEIDESFVQKRFRNLARMGPDILDVVTKTVLGGPIAGGYEIVKKLAEKARDDANLKPA